MSASALAGAEVLAMKRSQDQQPRCCTEAAGNRVAGFTCLPNWLFGQATAQELVVLLALQHRAPNIHPSLSTLARESGLSKRTVQNALRGMEGKGWLTWEQASMGCGRRAANVYQLLIWSRPADMAGVATWQEVPHQEAELIWQEVPGDMAGGATKQDQENNKRNPTALEPPLPPTARGERRPEAVAAGPCRDRDGFLISISEPQPPVAPEPPPEATAAVQPQPQQRPRPEPRPEPPPEPAQDPEAIVPVKPKAKTREAGFRPVHEDVPAALLPVVRELLAFWPARNPKAKRTQRAWEGMLTEAQKIQDHQQGGTEILREQLQEGAAARVSGPGWLGLNFNRWRQYGTKATTPVMGSGFRGRMTPEQSAAEAIAFIRNRDAKAAAAAAATTQQAVLVEVLA
jgi:outer membrane biosynthesis protein TonB